jgi:hypothetical protein
MSGEGDRDRDREGYGDARLAQAMAADEVPPPPDGLAGRVVEGVLAAGASGGRGPRRRSVGQRRRLPLAIALVAGAAAGALAVWLARPAGEALASGARTPSAQETIRLGDRAVLVAEAGAQLRWRPGPGRALLVEQDAGDVFYRVDAGDGPFLVETPSGVVRVRGTCFRVEVKDMKLINRQSVSAAALGAALGGALVVTVYEGRVLLARGRDEVALGPGDRGVIREDGAPRRISAGERDRAAAEAPALARAGGGVPRFDEAQALRTRIAEQEKQIAELGAQAQLAKKLQDRGGGRFLDPSKEELLARVERCEVRFDIPPIGLGSGAAGVVERQAQKLGLSSGEREAANQAADETRRHVTSELRRLYLELGGEQAIADRLSPGTLQMEIVSRLPPGANQHARRQLSRERAGLAAPPNDLGKTPVAERALRLMMSLGEDFERRLAGRIGAERAHDLRAREDGWQSKTAQNGCE